MFKVKHPDFPEYFVRDDGFVERAVDSQKHPKAGDLLEWNFLYATAGALSSVPEDGMRRVR